MPFTRHGKHDNQSLAGLSGKRLTAPVLLILSLLFAQWLGLAHAIGHAGVAVELSSEQQTPTVHGGFDHQKSATACAALEGATLGAALHSPVFLTPVRTTSPLPAVWMSEASWIADFHAYFSSRAPPLNA